MILTVLATQEFDEMGRKMLSPEKLREITSLTPAEINDAVMILNESGLVEILQAMGSAPYLFIGVQITPRGKYEYQSSLKEKESTSVTKIISPTLQRAPTPVGSPYGFTDIDWEILSERKSKNDTLYVIMGFQFESSYYKRDNLLNNVNKMFERAVEGYNKKPTAIHVKLEFIPLAAGYGEHLFNEIARDIISADIAVFDTSDLNPNVMIEMGVALTWGVRVLPIRKSSCPKPPSDISGQTWAEYTEDGSRFGDADHDEKLIRMVERAARKKRSV